MYGAVWWGSERIEYYEAHDRLLFGPHETSPFIWAGDTELVKSREMTRSRPNTAVVAGGKKGKDDRKQNTLAPLVGIEGCVYVDTIRKQIL